MTLRIALVNDHPLIVAGIKSLLEDAEQFDIVELDSALETATHVDLALLDTFGEQRPLREVINERLSQPTVDRLALFTWVPDRAVVSDALEAGACGVVSKSLPAEELAHDLEVLATGGSLATDEDPAQEDEDPRPTGRRRDWPGRKEGLTMRQAEMITLITQGLTNEQIANQLYLSPNSVKAYIRAAYRRIGVERRSQAVAWGIEHGLRPERKRVLY